MRFIIFLTVVIVTALVGFIRHQIMKSRMRHALGRNVRDSEATSLTSWMNVVEKEDQQRQEKVGGI